MTVGNGWMRPQYRIEVSRERFGESNLPCRVGCVLRQSSPTFLHRHDKRKDHFRVTAASSSARCRLVRTYLPSTLSALGTNVVPSLFEITARTGAGRERWKRKSAGKCRKCTRRRDESSATIDRQPGRQKCRVYLRGQQ